MGRVFKIVKISETVFEMYLVLLLSAKTYSNQKKEWLNSG